MKQIKTIVTGAALMLVGIAVTDATTVLREYAFNIDGVVTDTFNPPGGLTPTPEVTYGTFNAATGLGTLTLSVAALGAHSISVFFDHDLGLVLNDETGSAPGAPGAGQSWEIDEPGYGNNVNGYRGNIWADFNAGTLDGTVNSGGSGGAPTSLDDMAMAMGWSFTGPADILITLSQTAPGSGFYLRQYDADPGGRELFLSGVLTLTTPPPAGVPEGGATLTSLMCALFGLGALKYKVRH